MVTVVTGGLTATSIEVHPSSDYDGITACGIASHLAAL
jgi:hypothetical protein